MAILTTTAALAWIAGAILPEQIADSIQQHRFDHLIALLHIYIISSRITENAFYLFLDSRTFVYDLDLTALHPEQLERQVSVQAIEVQTKIIRA